MTLVRHYDQDERNWRRCSLEFDGTKTAKSVSGAWRERILGHIYHGSSKMRFQYCVHFQNSLMYIRAIQGHTGGNLIAPEWVGHVAIPYKWKEFLFSSRMLMYCTSILQSGHIAGGRVTRDWRQDWRQTVLFTHLNPFRTIQMENILPMTINTEKSTLSHQVENYSGRRKLGQKKLEHRTKDYDPGRQGLMT